MERGTGEVLQLNRQSDKEKFLKALSVFSIVFGVGILTTLGLMINTAIQTQGKSINFFTSHTNIAKTSFAQTIKSISI
ncbi:hypothetical protein NKV53_00885 [Legionella sp. 27cVA30]|uniref:hypothetical protein n=1 Tax=Legionella TaxID=445 RepID=UPI000F8E97AE|nr:MULTISPECIES: hypothetical protein [Legionella]MCP0912931.1 hypothetical protein [Legionella sp. 27cVA30]RUR15487.1 hypothetical protein ELY10_05770 [Legionella septentrionalis]